MANYSTKGKRAIIEYLKNNPDRQMSAEDIFASLGENAPGQSSVYRILSSMTKSGEVRRERDEGGDGFVYQYAQNMGCDKHFHLKCVECGKVVHLHCHVSDELISHIYAEHGFMIDSGKTVLYGRGAACGGAK